MKGTAALVLFLMAWVLAIAALIPAGIGLLLHNASKWLGRLGYRIYPLSNKRWGPP